MLCSRLELRYPALVLAAHLGVQLAIIVFDLRETAFHCVEAGIYRGGEGLLGPVDSFRQSNTSIWLPQA